MELPINIEDVNDMDNNMDIDDMDIDSDPVEVNESNYQDFMKLPISTQTSHAYINCECNLQNIAANVDSIVLNEDKKTAAEIETEDEFVPIEGMIYKPVKKSKPKDKFRNQLFYRIFFEKMISIKVFPNGVIHLTGTKSQKQITEGLKHLLRHILNAHTPEAPTITFADGVEFIECYIKTVMININFKIDFQTNMAKLNNLLQDPDIDFYSMISGSNSSLSVKCDYNPADNEYIYVKFGNPDDTNYMDYEATITTTCPSDKNKLSDKPHTFLVFDNKKIIHTGKHYNTGMKQMYYDFLKFIYKHRQQIELKPWDGNDFDVNTLSGVAL